MKCLMIVSAVVVFLIVVGSSLLPMLKPSKPEMPVVSLLSQCGSLQHITELLVDAYGEHVLMFGYIRDKNFSKLSVYVSPKNKTFTIVGVGQSGFACVLYSGKPYVVEGKAS